MFEYFVYVAIPGQTLPDSVSVKADNPEDAANIVKGFYDNGGFMYDGIISVRSLADVLSERASYD